MPKLTCGKTVKYRLLEEWRSGLWEGVCQTCASCCVLAPVSDLKGIVALQAGSIDVMADGARVDISAYKLTQCLRNRMPLEVTKMIR